MFTSRHQFRELTAEDASWKLFTCSELGQFNRIFTHLRRGGVAILSGDWEQVVEVMKYIERKEEELIRPSREGGRDSNKVEVETKIEWQRRKGAGRRKSDSGLARSKSRYRKGNTTPVTLNVLGGFSRHLTGNPTAKSYPTSLSGSGENQEANEGRPVLNPYCQDSEDSKRHSQRPIRFVRSACHCVAAENVLPPHSQETVELFQTRFAKR